MARPPGSPHGRSLLAACWCAGLTLFLAAGCDASPDASTPDGEPVLGALTERTILDERRITATLDWELGEPLRAPPWTGIVTSIPPHLGDTIETGDIVVEISGVRRTAAATAAPFYRALTAGDSGNDVAQLNTLLVTLGHLDPALAASAGNTYAGATTAAVGRFAEAIGASGNTFQPGWIIWLPHEQYRIGEIAVSLGAPAPPPGTEIMREAGVLVRVTLAAANANEALSLDASAEWVAVFREARYRVTAAELAFPPAVLADLAAALPDAPERIEGSVQRGQPLDVFALPSSAVMAGEVGLCIWTLDGKEYRSIPVRALSARAGVTNIARDGGLSLQTAVLANPSQVLEAPQCP
jgi:hypothetical protein